MVIKLGRLATVKSIRSRGTTHLGGFGKVKLTPKILLFPLDMAPPPPYSHKEILVLNAVLIGLG